MNKKEFIEKEDTRLVIEEIAGHHAIRVVELLSNKKILDEFKISSNLKLEVNFVRSLLYKLYDKKIVSFSKERDNKKGWWTYSWKLNLKRLVEVLIQKKKTKINRLEEIKTKELNEQYYSCNSCGIQVNFSEAIENKFECFSCGMPLSSVEKKTQEEDYNERIGKLYDEIKESENYILDIRKEEIKKKLIETEKIKKKMAAEKIVKKKTKKVVKKKVAKRVPAKKKAAKKAHAKKKIVKKKKITKTVPAKKKIVKKKKITKKTQKVVKKKAAKKAHAKKSFINHLKKKITGK